MKARALIMDNSGSIGAYSSGGSEPVAGRPLILLVHGYNNDNSEASQGYFAMRCNFDNVLKVCEIDKVRRQEFQSRIWELYWPGYLPLSKLGPAGRRRKGYEPVVSAPSYSLELIKARNWVPEGLSRYLSRVQPSEVFFIAHSLGCRVVLETVKRLSASLQHRIGLAGYLLMAGAVPIHLMGASAVLGASAYYPRRRYSLHSWRDTVLMLAFPPGEVLAGEVAPYGSPIATGLTGWPSSLWSSHATTQLAHGGYWKAALFKEKPLLSQLCAGLFGLAVDRNISVSELLTLAPPMPSSILPENQILSGNLPGSDWLKDKYGPP